MDIISAIQDERFFAPSFRDVESWHSWMVFLKALFGLPIKGWRDKRLFRDCTGRQRPPKRQAREAFAIVGRRGGKSKISSLLSVWLCCSFDWKRVLSPGEKGRAFIISVDKAQSRIIRDYCLAILEGSPTLKSMIKRETRTEIELSNDTIIEIRTSDYRSLRGYSIIFACLEEMSFFRDESYINPAQEIVTALRPGLATVPGSLLLGISTPYSKSGLLFKMYKRHYGDAASEESPLVWKADSRTMNPTISKKLIKMELAKDPAAAQAEWMGEFRSDISSFIPPELIEAATIRNRVELPPIPDTEYFAFTDPSGGVQKGDTFALSIAHVEKGRIVIDVCKEATPPFKPEDVCRDFSEELKRYGISIVMSDRYAGAWPKAAFQNHNIYLTYSEKAKSELYLNILPLLSNGSIELLDLSKLHAQLGALERRTRSGGKDIIDHPQGFHDDLSNVVAGVSFMASQLGSQRALPVSLGYSEPAPLTKEEELEKEARKWLLDEQREPSEESEEEKILREDEELTQEVLKEFEEADDKSESKVVFKKGW
jgi:hypothetical protein